MIRTWLLLHRCLWGVRSQIVGLKSYTGRKFKRISFCAPDRTRTCNLGIASQSIFWTL
nr:MAG TPA: hypothetical protein [Caudoviricetes sp.]